MPAGMGWYDPVYQSLARSLECVLKTGHHSSDLLDPTGANFEPCNERTYFLWLRIIWELAIFLAIQV